MCLKIMILIVLIKIVESYPANYVNYDYNEDYYSEDLDKINKISESNLGALKNMLSSYIDNYFETVTPTSAHRHHHKFEEYQNDDSGTPVFDAGTKLQKIGKLQPETNSTGDYYLPILNTTMSKFLSSKNMNSSAQTIQLTPWNDNILLKRRQEIDKELWKNELKKQILHHVGRVEPMDGLSDLSKLLKGHPPSKSFTINEKYQNFISKCEIPRNTDEETWKDSANMNLFFNINISSPKDGYSLYIAKATLSLFKISSENLTQNDNHPTKEGGDNSNLNFLEQEDRQIRVSIYWYTRSLKKHRVKRRLSDSKMVYVYDNKHYGEWIEFNIRPAAKSWLKTGRNLGLGVVIEDQEGTILPANKYFKHVDCITNNQASQTTASTNTKSQQIYDITEVFDPHESKSNDIDSKSHNQHNRKHHEHRHINGASPTSADNQGPIFPYLPTLKLCTIEIPTNLSTTETFLQNDSPPLLETTTHRTRHNHRSDPRNGTIQNPRIVFTKEEWIKIIEDMNVTSTETTMSKR